MAAEEVTAACEEITVMDLVAVGGTEVALLTDPVVDIAETDPLGVTGQDRVHRPETMDSLGTKGGVAEAGPEVVTMVSGPQFKVMYIELPFLLFSLVDKF